MAQHSSYTSNREQDPSDLTNGVNGVSPTHVAAVVAGLLANTLRSSLP